MNRYKLEASTFKWRREHEIQRQALRTGRRLPYTFWNAIGSQLWFTPWMSRRIHERTGM